MLLDGVPCTILYSNVYSITCIPGAKPSGSNPLPVYRPGPQGLLVEAWHNVTTNAGNIAAFASSANYPASPSFTTVSTAGGVSLNGGINMEHVVFVDGYMERSSGLFVAPLSTNYTFNVLSNYMSDLYISTTASRNNLTLVCQVAACASGMKCMCVSDDPRPS